MAAVGLRRRLHGHERARPRQQAARRRPLEPCRGPHAADRRLHDSSGVQASQMACAAVATATANELLAAPDDARRRHGAAAHARLDARLCLGRFVETGGDAECGVGRFT